MKRVTKRQVHHAMVDLGNAQTCLLKASIMAGMAIGPINTVREAQSSLTCIREGIRYFRLATLALDTILYEAET